MAVSKEWKGFAFIFMIIFIITVMVIVLYKSLKVDPVSDILKGDNTVNVLFVISDDDGNPLATEVFMCYPKTRRATVFDVTGNTAAIYKSLDRVDRIDAVYKEKGMETYCDEVEAFLGLSIPFTLEINLSDFGNLTDLMNGLNVFIPSPVDIVSPEGKRWMLPSGAVSLDGDKVQTYMEYILPDESDDDQEARRRDAFVAFMVSFNSNSAVFLNKKNFRVYSSKMKYNIEEKDFYELIKTISDIQMDTVTTQAVAGLSRIVDGKSLLFPYQDGQLMKDVVKQKARMITSAKGNGSSRTYAIEILNGTAKQGLASNASVVFAPAYNILQIGNADKVDYEHTVIINHIGNSDEAEALAEFITCYNIIDEDIVLNDEDVSDVDFTIILGKDWDGRYVRGGFGKDVFEESKLNINK